MSLLSAKQVKEVLWIDAKKISLPQNPVRPIELAYVLDLAQSIGHHGILHPITVRALGDDNYEVAAGGHRFMAMTLVLNWAQLPCLVRSNDDLNHANLLSIAENIQRNTNLDPLQEGAVFNHLETQGWSVSEIAQEIGKESRYVRDRLIVWTGLEPTLRADLKSKRLSFANARHIAEHHPVKQMKLAAKFGSAKRVVLSDVKTECTHSCPCHCPPS